MCSAALCFYLYYPETLAHWGKRIIRGTGAARMSYQEFKKCFFTFDDLGEINPNYTGLQRLHENLILQMAETGGNPLGFCVFRMHRTDLVEVDIIVVQRELRRMGLGRVLLGRLERCFPDGASFFVENTTFAGGRFFKRCGFIKDVDLIKVLKPGNRVVPVSKKCAGRRWLAC